MQKPLLVLLFLVPISLFGQNPFGSALSFDGDEAHVAIPHNAAYNMTNQMTIEVRVWAADYDPGGWQEFVFKGGGAPAQTNTAYREYYIRPQNNTGRAQFKIHDDQDNEYSAKSDSALVGGQCYHLAGVFDGATLKMYVNGVLEDIDTVGPITMQQDTGVLAIARQGTRSVEEFDGEIDEVRIWNVARSANQICQYVNDTLGPEYYVTADSGLVGYWRLDEGTDTIAYDLSVYQNHGSLRDNPMYVTTCTSPGCTPVGTENIPPVLTIGPNPVRNHVHIQMKQAIEHIVLTDLSGRVLRDFHPNNLSANIPMAGLPSGLYLVKVKAGNYQVVKRVVRLQ